VHRVYRATRSVHWNKLTRMPSLLVRNNEIADVVFSVASLLSSLSVVLTGVFFPQMWRRLFMHIIFFISLADMGASICAMFGYPRAGTRLCTIQAFGTSFFIKSTVFWTEMLCYQLYRLVVNGAPGLSFIKMHLMVWFGAAFVALLPLTTATYGRGEPNADVEWCFLHDSEMSLFIFWNAFDWIGIVIFSALLILYLARSVRAQLLKNKEHAESAGWRIYTSMMTFSLVLYATYLTMIVVNIFMYFYNTSRFDPSIKNGTKNQLLCVVNDIAIFYGISLSVIFYWRSPEARYRWKTLLFGGKNYDSELDFDENVLLTVDYSTKSKNDFYVCEGFNVMSLVFSGKSRSLYSSHEVDRPTMEQSISECSIGVDLVDIGVDMTVLEENLPSAVVRSPVHDF
jgi:hypothetical protein